MCAIYFQNKAETVILIAAHWHREKLPQWGLRRLFSQLPELAKVASAYSSSSRLPVFSWNMLMVCVGSGGCLGMLFIISHNPHSHTEHMQICFARGE